jgi:PIN like domain
MECPRASWKTPFVSHPGTPPETLVTGLPFVFVDRSLGRIQVPALLRAGGVQLVTLAEHYGVPADEQVQDVTWIAESAQRGWIAFMKDANVRRRPAEREAIKISGARCFCLVNANIRAAMMAERYLANLRAIERACSQPGPFLYAVHASRIEPLPLS